MKPRPILTAAIASAILGASLIAAAYIQAQNGRWQTTSEFCLHMDTWSGAFANKCDN